MCSNLFAQSLTDGLLLHYGFNGDTGDLSVNGNDAVNFGATFVEDRFGNPNAAIHFDGVDDYINFPNISELKPVLPVSFSFWIKYESYNLNDRAVFNTSFEEDRNTGIFFNSQASTGNYAINYGDGSYTYLSSTRRTYVSNSAIDVGNWHQIVIVVNSANDMEIYFDCNERGGVYSGSGGTLQYSDLPGSIGRHDRVLGSPANYFKGAMDDFRYWNRALTDENIAELLSTTLISSITFNNLTDCNANDGTITISDLNPNTFYIIAFDYLGSGVSQNIQSDGLGEITISNLSEGAYENIEITNDATGCSSDLDDVSLTAPNINAAINWTNPTDCGTADGSITISDLNATTNYTITYNYSGTPETTTVISDASGAIILSGLSAGIYNTIVVTEDATGCTDNLGQIILDEPDLVLSITSTDLTSCGSDDGTITISGLNPGSSYTITYLHNLITETLTITADASGNYVLIGLDSGIYDSIVVMEDISGCTDNLGQIILDEPDLGFSITSTDLTSCGSDDGTITISGLNSGSSYTITYLHNSVTETLLVTADASGSYVITGLESGVYDSIVVMEDISGCTDNLGQIILDEPDLGFSITSTDLTSCGSDDG
ncbi:LamG domain-containing protein, partial [Xanthomarina sp. GH4-25]|uniref:LamG domain-containing protein n=1 Tax=Xanthomarina sp. GH4-25 TaxID=3349335 RepID=UPI003878209E